MIPVWTESGGCCRWSSLTSSLLSASFSPEPQEMDGTQKCSQIKSSEIEQIRGSPVGTTDLISEHFCLFNSLESPSLSEKWEDC